MGRHAPQGRANLNAHVCAEFLLPAYSGAVAQRTTRKVQFRSDAKVARHLLDEFPRLTKRASGSRVGQLRVTP